MLVLQQAALWGREEGCIDLMVNIKLYAAGGTSCGNPQKVALSAAQDTTSETHVKVGAVSLSLLQAPGRVLKTAWTRPVCCPMHSGHLAFMRQHKRWALTVCALPVTGTRQSFKDFMDLGDGMCSNPEAFSPKR